MTNSLDVSDKSRKGFLIEGTKEDIFLQISREEVDYIYPIIIDRRLSDYKNWVRKERHGRHT